MQKIIDYLLNMGLKRYLPLLGVGLISGISALWAAHAGVLQQWGITYFTWPWQMGAAPSGPCILIELDTLSKAVIVLVSGAIPVLLRAFEHHAINPALPTLPTQAQETLSAKEGGKLA